MSAIGEELGCETCKPHLVLLIILFLDQAEQACLVEAGATAQPATPGPVEAGALGGATDDDEGIVSNKTSAESLKEPGDGTGSSAQTETSATDALIESRSEGRLPDPPQSCLLV